jgi:hypothetical protein
MQGTPPVEVDISDKHHVFFYSTTSPGTTGFVEFPPENFVHIKKSLHPDVWAYAAHAGMDNSDVFHLHL